MSGTAPDLKNVATLILDTLTTHLADPDPKVSLRAASELTKLLGTLARTGVMGEEQAALPTVLPVPVANTSAAPPRLKETPLQHPPAPNRVAEPLPPPRPLSLGGPSLTSFLGRPEPERKPPDRGNSA